MDIPVSGQSPQLARARSVLAAVLTARTTEDPGDVETIAICEALAIIAATTPPLPPIDALDGDEQPDLTDAVAALAAARAAAGDVEEVARLALAERAMTTPVAW